MCFVQSRFTLWDSFFSFNGSCDVTRGKERGIANRFCCCVVDFCDLEGVKWKLGGFFKSLSAFLLK